MKHLQHLQLRLKITGAILLGLERSQGTWAQTLLTGQNVEDKYPGMDKKMPGCM